MAFKETLTKRKRVLIIGGFSVVAIGLLVVALLAAVGLINISAEENTKCRLVVDNASKVKGYSADRYGNYSIDVAKGDHQRIVLRNAASSVDVESGKTVLTFNNSDPRVAAVGLETEESVATTSLTTSTTTTSPPAVPNVQAMDVVVMDVYGLRDNAITEVTYNYLLVKDDGTYVPHTKCNTSQTIKINVLNATGGLVATPAEQSVIVGDGGAGLMKTATYQISGGSGSYKYEEVSRSAESVKYSAQVAGGNITVTPGSASATGDVVLKIFDTADTKNYATITTNIYVNKKGSTNSALDESYASTKQDSLSLTAGSQKDFLSKSFSALGSTGISECYSTNPKVIGLKSKKVGPYTYEVDGADKSETRAIWTAFSAGAGSADIVCRSSAVIPGKNYDFAVYPVTVKPINLVVENANELKSFSYNDSLTHLSIPEGDTAFVKLKTSPKAADNIYDAINNLNPDIVSVEAVSKTDGGINVALKGLKSGNTAEVQIKHADMAAPKTITVDVAASNKNLRVSPLYQTLVPDDQHLGEATYTLSGGAGDYKVEIANNPDNADISISLKDNKATVTSKQLKNHSVVTLKAQSGDQTKDFYLEIAPTEPNDYYYMDSVYEQKVKELTAGESYINSESYYSDWDSCHSTNGSIAGLSSKAVGKNVTDGATKVYAAAAGTAKMICANYYASNSNKIDYSIRLVKVSPRPAACTSGKVALDFAPNAWNLLAMPWDQSGSMSSILGLNKTQVSSWAFKGLANVYEKTDNFQGGEGMWFNSGVASPACLSIQTPKTALTTVALPYDGFNLLTNPTAKPIKLSNIQIKIGDGSYRSIPSAFTATKPVMLKMLAVYDPVTNQYSMYVNKKLYTNYVSTSKDAVVYDIIDLPEEIPPYHAWWIATYSGGSNNKVTVKYSN